jgi:carboxylesterase
MDVQYTLKGREEAMEKNYPILEGAEPFYFAGNEIGILVQHGFTGTTQSMRYLGEALAKNGYTVCGPRLKGHGTHYEQMEGSLYQEWIASAEEGYLQLKEKCSKVFVIGLSMGGTLALHLAHKFPETAGIVLINAAVFSSRMNDVRELQEPRFLDAIGSDIKDPNVKELAYEKTPLQSVKQLLTFLDEIKPKVAEITSPALILSSVDDHVVSPDNAEFLFQNLASKDKTKVELTNSYHVATLDYDKDIIVRECEQFVQQLTK